MISRSSSSASKLRAERPPSIHSMRRPRTSASFLNFLVAALGVFLRLVLAAAEHFDVGEDELEIDGLNVAHGVVRALVADDVGIIKAADDVNDGIGVADIAEELVAETFALRRALDKTRDIHELDRGRGCISSAGTSPRDSPAARPAQ